MKFANGMSHNSMCVQTICKTNFHEIKSIFMFTRQILVLLPSSKSDYKWIFVSFFSDASLYGFEYAATAGFHLIRIQN